MGQFEENETDEDISAEALQALTQASLNAQASGEPLVVLEGRTLVRISAEGRETLRELPPRWRPIQLFKRIRK